MVSSIPPNITSAAGQKNSSISVDLHVRQVEPLREMMSTFSCDSRQILTVASVYIDVSFEALNMSSQLMLLKKFSAYLGVPMTSLLIKTSSDPQKLEPGSKLLRSGVGNKNEKSAGKVTSLEWAVGCGNVNSSFEPPLTLLDKTAHEILGSNIGSDILLWRVTNIEIDHERSFLSHSPTNYDKEHVLSATGTDLSFELIALTLKDMPGDEPAEDHEDEDSDVDLQNKRLHFENKRASSDDNTGEVTSETFEHPDEDATAPSLEALDGISTANSSIDVDEESDDPPDKLEVTGENEDVGNENYSRSNGKLDYDEVNHEDEDLPHEDHHQHEPSREELGKKKRTKHNKHRNPKINKLSVPSRILVGSILEFRLPADVFKTNGAKAKNVDLLFLTFTDSASDMSRKIRNGLQAKLSKNGNFNSLSETIGVPPISWIRLNQTTLYGLPLEEHVGKHRYVIALVNKKVLSKFELEIEVMKPTSQVLSHEFEVTIKDLDYKRAAQDVFLRIDMMKKLASAFGDQSSQNILVTGMFPGSVKIVWSNLSLPVTPCPFDELARLTKYIFKDGPHDKEVSPNFKNSLKPYSLSSARFIARGSCRGSFPGSLAEAHQDRSADEIQMDPVPNEENVTTLLYIMIPMVAVAAFLLIVLLTCVCCYVFGDSRRPGFMRSQNVEAKELPPNSEKNSKKSGSGNCVPIIFAEELKNPTSVHPAKPVLADQVCPRTPPPTYTHSVNLTDSTINASLRSHRHKPTPLECSFSGNSNSFFSGSSHDESENSLRDLKLKTNDSWMSGKRTGSKGDFQVRSEALNNYL